MLKRIAFLLALACALGSPLCLYPQAYTSTALQNSTGNYARVVPFAPVTVCASSDLGSPCTTKVTTYTDQTLLTQCSLSSNVIGAPASGAGCNNPGIADANGNFSVFLPAGNYRICTYAQNYQCATFTSPSVATAGLADPGSNGILKRTALNTTAIATGVDIVSLFTGCSGVQYLGADAACHSVVAGVSSVFGRSGAVVATLGDYNLALLNGGIAPAAATYDFATNNDLVTVPTQASSDSSTKAASTAFTHAISNPRYVVNASDYIANTGRFVFDATFTNLSQTVTCPNSDCNFTSADIGKLVAGVSCSQPIWAGGFCQTASTISVPQGTITAVNSAQSIQVSIAATASVTGGSNSGGLLAWGVDETTALNTAFTAALNACGVLQLPGENVSQTGPAVMLVTAPFFNTNAHAANNCGYAGQDSRQGVTIEGVENNATYIIPMPSFDYTQCTKGSSGKACSFSIWNGGNVRDLTVWALGLNSANTSANIIGKYAVEWAPANATPPGTQANTHWFNVNLLGWGGDQPNGFDVCLYSTGGTPYYELLAIDGCGRLGAEVFGPATLINSQIFDNADGNLYVPVSSSGPVMSIGNTYGVTLGGSVGCAVQVLGALYSHGDIMGDGFGGINLGNTILCSGLLSTKGATTSSNGTVYLNGTDVNGGHFQGAFTNGTTGTGKIYAINSRIKGPTDSVVNAGQFFDLGGNTFTGTWVTSGSGVLIGQASVQGTAITAAKLVLSAGWGTTAAWTSLTGQNTFSGTITASGTGQLASPTITYTFPNAYQASPAFCNATQVGGTQAVGTFAASSLTATGVTFTYSGTPGAGNTLIVQGYCYN